MKPNFTTYATAAGAVATASIASGAIVYSGEQNLGINQGNSLNLDLNLDLQGDVVLKNYVFFGGPYQGATVNFAPGKLVSFQAGPSNFWYVSNLAAGATIDSSTVTNFFGSMAYGANNPNAQFNSANPGLIGLSFPAGPDTYYGWIRVQINNASGTFNVVDWAYEDQPGVGILAGVVPEPSALGLLAAGAIGLASYRRRSQA